MFIGFGGVVGVGYDLYCFMCRDVCDCGCGVCLEFCGYFWLLCVCGSCGGVCVLGWKVEMCVLFVLFLYCLDLVVLWLFLLEVFFRIE